MKRRRNFFWGDAWEVRAYVYGKDRAREGRNVETWRFSDRAAAERRFERERRKGYPTLELVNLETGQVVSWVSTGERYNAGRRTRKARKARTSVTKRDVFAQVAKARKTTKGHRRKERARAVAKGHTRRAKHRRRYNPDADEQRWTKFRDKLSAAYPEDYAKEREAIHNQLRRFISDLKRAGVPSASLPSPAHAAFGQMAERAAAIVVAAGHAQYRTDSAAEFGVKPKALAMRLFQVGPNGVFEAFYAEHPDVFNPAVAALAKKVKNARGRVTRADAKARKAIAGVAKAEVTKAQQKADRDEKKLRLKMAALQAELGEDIPDDIAAELAEQYSDTERELEAEELREEEPLTPAALTLGGEEPAEHEEGEHEEGEYYEGEYYEARVSPTQRAARRLGQYKRHRADVRRTDVRPPLQVVADAREDILLYALKDGTTQVWAKGALTETFLPDKNTSSVTIAHRYANRWRGLGPKGRLREGTDEHPPPKKSRLRSRVLLAVEGKKGVKEIEKSIAQSIGRVTPKATRVHELPDLDTYELKGDRANPRRRRNTRETEISFYSSLSENQLYALRLGKWYRLSMPRSREVFGREAVEHILSEAPGEISTSISRDEWKYLLPKEVPHSRHGPDETAHYRNPRRRRNGDRSAPHGLSKAEEKRVRAEIQQDLVGAFMRVLRQRPRESGPSDLEAHKIEWGSMLLGAYKSENTTGDMPKIRREFFGSSSMAPLKARRWLTAVGWDTSTTVARWDTIIRAAAKEAIGRHKARPNPKRRKNSRGTSGAVFDLVLFIEKDGDLYRQQTKPIIMNLARKMHKGTFDKSKAPKLFQYLADAGAKKINKAEGYTARGYGEFTPEVRREAAKQLLVGYMENIEWEARELAHKEKGTGGHPRRRKNSRVGRYVVYVSDGGTSRGRVVGTIVFGPDPDGYPETPQSIARNVYGHLRKKPRSRVHVKYEDEASERDLELAREREWKNRNLNNPRRRRKPRKRRR